MTSLWLPEFPHDRAASERSVLLRRSGGGVGRAVSDRPSESEEHRPRRRKSKKKAPPALALGWREWAALPELGIEAIKAKLDTGARTSSLHAFGIELFERDGIPMVRFEVHPEQRSRQGRVRVEAEVLDERWIRNSGGVRELRPVIETDVRIGEETWPIELTLTRRDEMGFRMLLGRQAIRTRAVVDPGSSFRAGRRKSEKRQSEKKTARTRRKPKS